MVYKKNTYRKKTYRKKPYRKKSVYKRTFRKKRPISAKTYYFKRSFEVQPLTCANGAQATGVYSLSLGNVPDVTDFTNLFDSYRIAAIKLTFTPGTNMFNDPNRPRFNLYSVIDRNDISALTTVNEALEYQNMHRTTATMVHKRYFNPSVPTQMSDISSTAFVQTNRPPWISCNNTDIAHGFLKVISDVNTSPGDYTWLINCTIYMSFKTVK